MDLIKDADSECTKGTSGPRLVQVRLKERLSVSVSPQGCSSG